MIPTTSRKEHHMPRHIYALVVDCDDESSKIERLLEGLAETIRSRGWDDIVDLSVHVEVPMVLDDRRQDRTMTQPVISLESR
jgi:hypothetical protein